MKLCLVVSGKTYAHREHLRSRGYKWDATNKVWVSYIDHEDASRNELEKTELSKLGLLVDVADADNHYEVLNKKKLTPTLPAPEPMPSMAGEWTYDIMRDLLLKDDRAVAAALVAIYNKQTEDEKRTSDTHIHNGVGFRANHASRGSYYARWILSGKALSGEHIAQARKIALFYAQQLIDLANKKRG